MDKVKEEKMNSNIKTIKVINIDDFESLSPARANGGRLYMSDLNDIGFLDRITRGDAEYTLIKLKDVYDEAIRFCETFEESLAHLGWLELFRDIAEEAKEIYMTNVDCLVMLEG
jgi:predicted transcriptional regulator of viral defense system